MTLKKIENPDDLIKNEGYLIKVRAPDYPNNGTWWTLAEWREGYFDFDEHRIVIEPVEIYELPD